MQYGVTAVVVSLSRFNTGFSFLARGFGVVRWKLLLAVSADYAARGETRKRINAKP
jgi:hypothetical protein